MIKNSKILITGAGGFIGLHLSKYFKRLNCEVHGIFFNKKDNEYIDKKIICDITLFKNISKSLDLDYDHVFHLAGIASIQKSIINPSDDFNANLVGTFNLLEFFRSSNIKSFNFISTVSVLSSNNSLPLNEESTCNPLTPYAISKRCSELYCKNYFNLYKLPVKVIRLFNVYGPGKESLVVFDFIKKLSINKKELVVGGDGNQIRDFLYIDDVISGLAIIAKKGNAGEIFHLGSGKPLKIKELANIIISIMDIKNIELIFDNKSYDGEFLKWYADIKKIKRIGINPKIDIHKGIKKTIDWFLSKDIT